MSRLRTTRGIWCCACGRDVEARRANGAEIYPLRPDLADLLFWVCPTCGNHVGTHKGTCAPLGNIPTPELAKARRHIHAIADPLWRSGRIGRDDLYAKLSERLGWQYHTAKLRTIEEARTAWRAVRQIERELSGNDR